MGHFTKAIRRRGLAIGKIFVQLAFSYGHANLDFCSSSSCVNNSFVSLNCDGMKILDGGLIDLLDGILSCGYRVICYLPTLCGISQSPRN